MQPYFERGNDAEIAIGKILYRRMYKAQWRKANRKTIKEITTTWTKDEYRELTKEAKSHKQSVTRFVKESAIAYMNQRFIYPDEILLRKAVQLLALIYNGIAELGEASMIPNEATQKLLANTQQLERDIRVALFSPKTIEQALKEDLSKHPEKKAWLVAFIQNLSI